MSTAPGSLFRSCAQGRRLSSRFSTDSRLISAGSEPPHCRLPLAPRRPRQCVERHERRRVGAIILPCRISGIPREVPRAPPATFTEGANSLEILERSRLSSSDLVPVEVKRCHSTRQEVGCFTPLARQPAELGGRDPHVLGDAPNFVLAATLQFRRCRTPSSPISPPSRNSLDR